MINYAASIGYNDNVKQPQLSTSYLYKKFNSDHNLPLKGGKWSTVNKSNFESTMK